MFEGRFPELLIIFVVALIVLGPHKLPEVATLIGRWLGNARAMARQFREQLEEEAQNLQRPVVNPTPPASPAAPPAQMPTAEVASAPGEPQETSTKAASHERGV